METSNLLDTEFKTLVIRMLNKLTGRVDKHRELQQQKEGHGIHKKEAVRNEGYTN